MKRINWKLKTPGRKSSLNLWISVPYCVAVGTDLFTRNNSKETPAHIHQMPKCLFSEFSACCFILNPKKGKIWDRNLFYVASRRDIRIIKSLLSRNVLLLAVSFLHVKVVCGLTEFHSTSACQWWDGFEGYPGRTL